ncbi:MAG: hypothetical protein LBF67_00745 [Prevotellaceae bacterium]|jgi:hypothetical protein|nr:hypothetical protein [Prevotellaceae bacterium]
MKKIYATTAILALLSSGIAGVVHAQGQSSLMYEVTPAKLFDYLTQYRGTSDTTGCGPTQAIANGNNYRYDAAAKKVVLRNNNGSALNDYPVSGVNYNLGRNNSNDEIYKEPDSMIYKATGDYGPTIRFNNTEGTKKVLYTWGLVKLYKDDPDPNEREYGAILTMICGTDTVRDTLAAHPTVRMKKTSSYTLTKTGQQTVQFKIIKYGVPYNGGNTAFFGMRVYDAAIGGYLLATPCEPHLGGVVQKTPDKHGYDTGDVVQLTATPNPGYLFTQWSDGETDPIRSITVTAKDTTLTAIFTAIDYDFGVSVSPQASWGTVAVNPVKENYQVGNKIELIATASSANYRFDHWSDGVTTASRTFTMPADNILLVATFQSLAPRSLSTTVSPANSGTVQATPRVAPVSPGAYFDLDVVDLVATANSGYEFVRWSDGTDDPEYTVRFNGENISLTAEFRPSTSNPPVPTPLPKPVIRVDFNIDGRQEKEVNEPRYTPWVVSATTKSKAFGDVTITLDTAGGIGKGLKMQWYKTSLQAPYFARVAGDAVTVDGGNAGGQIKMTISNLKKGAHSLLLYFNTLDNPANNTFSPVDIYVKDEFVQQVMPTNRVMDNAAMSVVFLEFTVRDYEDMVIRMAANTAGGENIKNVYCSGFELNVPNIQKQARKPSPEDMDEHVNADKGSITLRWEKAFLGAKSHDVYWGIDSARVESADKSSPEFKGTKSADDTSLVINDIYSMNTYYWRIDEVGNDDVLTRGNVWYFRPRQLAFRGAEGYGRYARGGRGGKVVYVTNLNDSGPGSFREAIRNEIGPRYILFNVSGNIMLEKESRITLNSHYVTVAGQTAPGKGINISRSSFGISGAKDAVVRFVRVRLGQHGYTSDGMGMNDANYSIMDHNSISWTIDESFSSRSGKNFSLQRTLISEPLNQAGHKNYSYGTSHGYAATIGGDTASFHHNLLAHSYGRNWSLGGGLDGDGNYAGHLDIFNNVVYNYGGRVTDGGAKKVNFVNNYYKAGRHSTTGMLKPQHEATGGQGQQYYPQGNVLEAYNNGAYGTFTCAPRDSGVDPQCGCSYSGTPNEGYPTWVDKPFFPSHATVHTARNAFKDVISDVGCNMPALDEHDLRVSIESRDGTWKYKGSYGGNQGIPDHHLDVGGYEDYPEIVRPADFDSDLDGLPNWWEDEVSMTNPNSPTGDFSETNADPDRDGYVNLESYLEWMATPHVTTAKNRKVAIELSQFTRGYTKNPVYTSGAVEHGALTIDGSWARFQPEDNYTGIAYFEFKVTDGDGDEMTRRIGVRIAK